MPGARPRLERPVPAVQAAAVRAGRRWAVLWRDPRRAGLLMWAYFLLSLLPGPAIYVTAGAPPHGPQAGVWAFSAFLTWRVTRGGRISRMVLIVGSWVSYLGMASEISLHFAPVTFINLAVRAAQIALLLSPAVYQRTRPGGRAEAADWIRARPPLTLLLLGVFAGLGVTLLGWSAMGSVREPLWGGWFRGAPVVSGSAMARDWVQYAVMSASLLYAVWLAVVSERGTIPGSARPRRRRQPALPVAVLALAAALGVAGSAAAAAGIISRIADYASATVYLHPGHEVTVMLPSGHYAAFAGCADRFGCAQLDPRQLSVRARSGTVDVAAGPERLRYQGGQAFLSELAFTVPARQQVQLALSANPAQPVFVTRSDEGTHPLRGWIVVAIVSGAVLLGSAACLQWLLARRAGPGDLPVRPAQLAEDGRRAW